MKTFKKSKAIGFFDEDFRLDKLTRMGDPLIRLTGGVNFEIFRDYLNTNLQVDPIGKGGRRPYDYVLMFKVLVLQRYYNISDDQTEYQICDRLSFMRFLGLKLADDVPDSKTIWLFRERLTELGLVADLFALFLVELERLGMVIHEGKIVDASFVDVPKQRNSREENAAIKEGNVPEGWQDRPSKLAQKDVDARWTQKNNISYFGYKNHTKCDQKSKLITGYLITDASVHDSQATMDLLDAGDEGQLLYADSAYSGKELNADLVAAGVIPAIIEKGYRNKPLTDGQVTGNKEKSKIRVRVEHIFAFIENTMNGSTIRSIGLERAITTIGLMNLTYNMFRKIQLSSI